MAESSLQRLLSMGASLPNTALRNEQRELVHKLAQELHVPLVVLRDTEAAEEMDHTHKKTHVRDEIGSGPSSAREKFQRQERQQQREQQQSSPVLKKLSPRGQGTGTMRSPPPSSNGSGTADCDISSSEIKNAYVNSFILYLLLSPFLHLDKHQTRDNNLLFQVRQST